MEEESHIQLVADLNGANSYHSSNRPNHIQNVFIGEALPISTDSMSQIEIIPIDNVESGDEIIETYEVQQNGSLLQVTNDGRTKKLTRKRKLNCKGWKRNISKANRQSGNAYKNINGEIKPARNVRASGCSNAERCPFQCMEKINIEGRQAISKSYWALNDSEKRHFYVANVKKAPCIRKRTTVVQSRKSYVLKYYFNYMNEDIRVCQQFFVNTLDVNKGRIYYYFKKNNGKPTVTPGLLRHGTHRKKFISEEQKQSIRNHINKFPVVESHYCRQNSDKKYLYQGLNLATMYRLYEEENENPAKLSCYRNIFNYEFNLSFFCPKKDRCDKCMAYEILTNPTDVQIKDQHLHLIRKLNGRSERQKDRDVSPTEHKARKSAIADMDMENVFQVPITNASTAYYKRKFAVLNLTVAINKIIYNAMWDESLCGREGTHIANAFIKILKKILEDNPWLEHLTLWSDSCVPQNRNSIMAAAIQYFLNSSASMKLKQIDQKFSEPGHGQGQAVDTAHSVVERFLRNKFIYSPPSLVKEINKIPEKKLKFIVIPMEEDDYLNYHLLAHAYKYSVIPFTKVKQLTYKKNEAKVFVKFDFNEQFVEKIIELKPRTSFDVGGIQRLPLYSKISAEKISDIESLYYIMPEIDKLFYQNIFENSNELQVVGEIHEVGTESGNPKIETTVQEVDRKVTKRKQQSRLPQVINLKIPGVKQNSVLPSEPKPAVQIGEKTIPKVVMRPAKPSEVIDLKKTISSIPKQSNDSSKKYDTVMDVEKRQVIQRERKMPLFLKGYELSGPKGVRKSKE